MTDRDLNNAECVVMVDHAGGHPFEAIYGPRMGMLSFGSYGSRIVALGLPDCLLDDVGDFAFWAAC
jgi:hypothetical protein